MKQPMFMKNVPIDEKRISFIEKIISRLVRRAHKTTTLAIPSNPLYIYAHQGDLVHYEKSYILPHKGMISEIIIILEDKVKCKLVIKSENQETGYVFSREYTMSKKLNIVKADLLIKKYSLLTISLDIIKGPATTITGTLVYNPTVDSLKTKQFLISSLEEDDQDA